MDIFATSLSSSRKVIPKIWPRCIKYFFTKFHGKTFFFYNLNLFQMSRTCMAFLAVGSS